MSAVPLPGGVTVTAGRLSKDSGHPGMQALKASPLGEELFAVYVAGYQVAGKDVKNQVKIKDPDFQLNLWSEKPSAAAESTTWEVVVG